MRPDVQNKQVEGEEPTEQQVENSYGKTTKEEEQERRHERLEIPKNIYGDDPTEQQVENSYEKTIEELQRRERREFSIMRRNEGQIRRPTYSFFQELIQHPVGNSYAKTTKEKEEEHEEPPERDYGDLRFLKHIYGDEPTEQQVESRYRKRTEEEEQKIAYGDLEFMKMYNSMTEKAKSDIRFRPIVPTERAIKRNAALLDRLLKHMSESR